MNRQYVARVGGALEASEKEFHALVDDPRRVSDQVPKFSSVEWFVDGIIERRKLEEYLLSPTHLDGRNKLRLWRSVFGIGEGDAELLEHLLRVQLPQVEPEEREPVTTREDPPRTVRRWKLVIPHFRGPNGNEGPVLTAWALDPDRGLPHLTTARPLMW